MNDKKPRSEKRRRTVLRPARFTPEEAAIFDAKAKPYGGCSAYIRNLALDKRLPQSKLEMELYAKGLRELGRLRDEMNKQGSNLNQLTHYANMGRTLEARVMEALEDHARACRTIDELRLVHLQAMGIERPRKPSEKD